MVETRLIRDISVLAAIGLLSIILFLNTCKRPARNHYDLEDVSSKTDDFIRRLNDVFVYYQDTLTNERGNIPINLTDSFLVTFRATQVYPDNEPPTEYLRVFDSSIQRLAASRDKFSYNNLLRLKKTGSYYSVVTDKSQFHENLFSEKKQTWNGDILAEKANDNYYLYDINTEAVVDSVNVSGTNSNFSLQEITNLKMKVIPAPFTKEQLPKILVTGEPNEESKEASINFYLLDKQTLRQKNNEKANLKNPNLVKQGVYSFYPGDFMLTAGRNTGRRILFSSTNLQYFATHLWINGKEDTYYPLGADLLWAKHCYDYYTSNLETTASYTQFISLDYSLQQNLASIISRIPQFRPASERYPQEAMQIQHFISLPWAEKRNGTSIKLVDDRVQVDWSAFSTDFAEILADDVAALNRELLSVSPNNPFTKNNLINSFLNRSVNNSMSMSFVCADGEGRIRVMLDKKGNVLQVDPNDHKMMANVRKDLDQNSSYLREKEFWGNLCLLNQSPGSTFKPIVYTSIGSQFRSNIWSQLNFNSNNTNNQNPLNYFAGVDMRNPDNTENGWNDLHDSRTANVTPEMFLISSKNIYNAIMLYLGSYNQATLSTRLFAGINPILRTVNPQTSGDDRFPIVSIGNNNYSFSTAPESRPGDNSGWFTSRQSILAEGLANYFDISLSLHSNPGNLFDKNRSNWTTSGIRPGFALPEAPFFIMQDREKINPQRPNDYDRIFQGIKQCAMGASPIKMSPLAMTQNYLRIFTASDNVNVHLDTGAFNNKSLSNPAFDPSYQNPSGFVENFLAPRIYNPLSRVRTGGTFSRYNTTSLGIPELANNRYYLYMKTATIGAQGGRKNKSLALVISQNNISDIENAETLQRNKIMVCYFTFYSATNEGGEGGTWPPFTERTIRRILQALLHSSSFQRYFADNHRTNQTTETRNRR